MEDESKQRAEIVSRGEHKASGATRYKLSPMARNTRTWYPLVFLPVQRPASDRCGVVYSSLKIPYLGQDFQCL
ncbi:hypothetical protein RRG08_044839 [Elysia crispata]|uniref:Uncharacterized protein n=1 Tax=Elysia crispata TaxID=231223 RepID=A0AAE1DRW6_9GAST|nr:hypothetical protein RRG08_044839 [Elysia crispata]